MLGANLGLLLYGEVSMMWTESETLDSKKKNNKKIMCSGKKKKKLSKETSVRVDWQLQTNKILF